MALLALRRAGLPSADNVGNGRSASTPVLALESKRARLS
jgi:hypothetical protein